MEPAVAPPGVSWSSRRINMRRRDLGMWWEYVFGLLWLCLVDCLFLPKQPDEPGTDMRLRGEKGMKQRSGSHFRTEHSQSFSRRCIAMVKDGKAWLSLHGSLNMQGDLLYRL